MIGRRSKPTEKTCGVKVADGEPCASAAGHDSTTWWETRIHRTVGGTEFNWKQGQKEFSTFLRTQITQATDVGL